MALTEHDEDDVKDLKIVDSRGHNSRTFLCDILNNLPDFIICCGVALGLYCRWVHYSSTLVLSVGLCGIFIFSTNLALRYYFSIFAFNPLFQVWLSASITLIGLLDDFRLSSPQKYLDNLVDVFFIGGCSTHFLAQFLLIVCRNAGKYSKERVKIMSINDYCRIVGMISASLTSGSNFLPIFGLISACFVNLLALKLKSMVAILNMLTLCALSESYIFPHLNLSINPYAIICVLLRLYNKPIVELFFILSSTSRLERYSSCILSRKFILRLFILLYSLSEATFFYIYAREIGKHKEWYVVVPIFAAISIFWLLTKLLVLVVLHNLIEKFHQCKLCLMSEGLMVDSSANTEEVTFTLKKILAAKGLRYFGLVAHKLVYASILATCLIAAVCWTTFNVYQYALTSIVVALQILFCELLNEFTYNLGGTCVGYGIVVPVAVSRSDNFVAVLSQQFVQTITLRATTCIDAMVKFFGQHLVENFGCDLSTSGLDWSDIRKKLATFFDQSTPEGPPFDTYILYYSGPVNDKGDWAMTGNTVVSLGNILEIWREKSSNNDNSGTNKYCRKHSRLILICDCLYSDQWLKLIKKISAHDFVAMQTFSLDDKVRTAVTTSTMEAKSIETSLVEVNPPPCIGDFTRLWVEYNGPNSKNRSLFESIAPDLHPRYQISKNWSDFHFARPNTKDICDFWRCHLPACAHRTLGCFVAVVNAPPLLPDSLSDYLTCLHFFKRWRMKFFPPAELDTGHGFKLVKG
uniref:Transmembrane protein 168 n=1 Tax=Romanomermis culicivorax TaxID=13658 RepID=A0A915L8T7_ROMCU